MLVELSRYAGASRAASVLATFFVSALAHEVIVCVAFKTFRPWFFLGMLAQLPLTALGAGLRGRRRGNLVVWASLFIGQPLLEILYVREWFATHDDFFCVKAERPLG
jgi:hypothetical protein